MNWKSLALMFGIPLVLIVLNEKGYLTMIGGKAGAQSPAAGG